MERAKETLLRLLTSAKVWAAISGAIIALFARRGIILSPEDVALIRDLTLGVVGALGLQDLGKAVAASKTSPVAVAGDLTVNQQPVEPNP